MTASPLLYLQSGGPTPVLNASAQGVIEAARRHGHPLYAARDGLAGLVEGWLVDTTPVTENEIARLSSLPGGAFGVSRHMIPTFEDDPQQWLRVRDVLERHDIHHVLVNGGNGSLGAAERLAAFEQHTGYPLAVIGIPKTIDNDLEGTDFSPGFPSAARFLATVMREVALDMTSMGAGRVFIMETMGRHVGWLAASTAMAAQYPGEAPHIILLPEVAFDTARFLARIDECLRAHGQCAIAVAEGLLGPDGRPVAESRHDSVYGHEQLGGAGAWVARLVKQESGITAHVAQVDYLQRAARHLASAVDLRMAQLAGKMAVDWALAGMQSVMTGIRRRAGSPVGWEIEPVELARVGDRERVLPAAFFDAANLTVTPAFLDYMRPLLVGETIPPCGLDGLPNARPISWPEL